MWSGSATVPLHILKTPCPMRKYLFFIVTLLMPLQLLAWKPLFVGHRGCYKGVENTVEAYRNGVDVYGYDGLECDVRVTADGKYVISHDETTERLGGSLTVASATLEQLQAENYTQTRGGTTYTGKICTVAEYLDICVEKNVFPVVELKWTTGINNNDMSNFPGLAQLIIQHGLADKVIILTSMKNSLEYVRTNYPDFTCQWLCNANWDGNEQWCKTWNFAPSISTGNFDIHTVKKFHNLDLPVACWTVDTEANYKKYGQMGVAMMTCNYLMPSEMGELDPIDWDAIDDVLPPLELKCDTLFSFTRFKGNLPQGFPSKNANESTHTTGQQAAIIDGVFYVNDYGTSTLLAYDSEGATTHNLAGTNSHGCTHDDAGNLILRNDGITPNPGKLRIYPYGETTPVDIDFELPFPGQTNFITASGDVMSSQGGFVYFFPNQQKRANIVHIANGALVGVSASQELSIAGSTAGVVYPQDNDTTHFYYQVRSNGFYLYDKGDKGEFFAAGSSVNPPARNSSIGFATATINGHKLFIHPSGTNYNGGFTVRDISAESYPVLTVEPMGNGGYTTNASVGMFMKVVPEDENSVILYEYCMGNGYAAYRLYTEVTGVKRVKAEKPKLTLAPNPASDLLTIKSGQPIGDIDIYSLDGSLMQTIKGAQADTQTISVAHLPAGHYIIQADKEAQVLIKR